VGFADVQSNPSVVVALLALCGSLGSTLVVAFVRRHWDMSDRRDAEEERLRDLFGRCEAAYARLYDHDKRVHESLHSIVRTREEWLNEKPRTMEPWELLLLALHNEGSPAFDLLEAWPREVMSARSEETAGKRRTGNE